MSLPVQMNARPQCHQLVPLLTMREHNDICIEQPDRGTAIGCVPTREARQDDHRRFNAERLQPFRRRRSLNL